MERGCGNGVRQPKAQPCGVYSCALASKRSQTEDPQLNPLDKRRLEPPSGKSRSVRVRVNFWLVKAQERKDKEPTCPLLGSRDHSGSLATLRIGGAGCASCSGKESKAMFVLAGTIHLISAQCQVFNPGPGGGRPQVGPKKGHPDYPAKARRTTSPGSPDFPTGAWRGQPGNGPKGPPGNQGFPEISRQHLPSFDTA